MRLVYERGGEQIAFPIDEGETYIGRKDYCDLHLAEPSLSKRHVRLVREGSRLLLYDAGSRNGTRVNGEPAGDGYALRNGDVIQAGKVEFRVEGVSADSGGFDVMDESDPVAAGSMPVARAVASHGAGSNLKTFPEVPLSRSGRQVARAVHSQSARGSVLDVLPELEGEPAAPQVSAKLILVDGPTAEEWELIDGTLTVGSKPENDIVINGDGVSRYHAEVVRENGAWLIKDLGSRNGLFVGGEKADIHELQDGDEVLVGTVKLRYEVVTPSSLAPLQEMLDKLKERGLVNLLKEDRRARMGASIVVFVLLMLILSSGDSGPGPTGPASGPWLSEGVALMVQENYKAAEQRFQRAISTGEVAIDQQHIPRTLGKTCGVFGKTDDPFRFRWDRAEDSLTEITGLGELPVVGLDTWHAEKLAWVVKNREAYDALTTAESVASTADEQASLGRFEEAYQSFHNAIAKFRLIKADTVFGDRAVNRVEMLQVRIYALVLEEIQRRLRVTSPQWNDVLNLIDRAEDFADTTEKRSELRALKSDCRTNARDEQSYMKAVDIVNAREVTNYNKALRLLDGISPRSRIYPDARAYMDWIDADLKVRAAKKLYDQGDEQQAFDLLNEALRHEVLGPEARASVRTRRQKWANVARNFALGMEQFRSGQLLEAIPQFEAVLEAEPNRANRFHAMAIQQLEHIQIQLNSTLEHKMAQGMRSLADGRHEKAIHMFEIVKQDQNVQRRDLEQIRFAVDDMLRRQRMVRAIERDVFNNRTEKYLDHYYTLKLLRLWLPASHPQMDKIERYFGQIQDWCKTMLRNHPDFQPPPRRRR